MGQLDRLDRKLATSIWIKTLIHRGALEAHGRHLRRMRVLGRRSCIQSLRAQLAGRKVLVLHGWGWGVGEALLLEAKLGLLRRGLRARKGERRAGRVSFLWYRRHWIGARAVHLRRCDCAWVDEVGRIIHAAVLGRLEIHGARLPET